MRGVRGATTVATNERTEILERVIELLSALVTENNIHIEDIGAVIFSSTPDLNAAFPAAGARRMGWTDVPLFGTQEIDNPEGLPLCIRVLILLNTDLLQKDIKNVYLRNSEILRQDVLDENR